jgi:DNA repair photolyase
VISITILTLDDKLSQMLEPCAPVSSMRLEAVETLIKAEIPTTVRIDPVIPFLNDDLTALVENVSKLGILHLTCSTYKVKTDNWKRFSRIFPEVAKKLKPMYFTMGRKIGNSFYLPEKLRFDMMKKAGDLAREFNLKFGCCREGFGLNSAICDGSWIIQEEKKSNDN